MTNGHHTVTHRRAWRQRTIGLVFIAALAAAISGCGGSTPAEGMSNDDAGQLAYTILTQDAARAERLELHDVKCMKESDRRFACIAYGGDGESAYSVPVSLACDESGTCITKSD